MKRLLVAVAAALVLHAVMLRIAAGWSVVAALLSPGPHSGAAALIFAVVFVGLRLLVFVAAPVAALATAAFFGVSWLTRGRSSAPTSPTRAPGPMLSAPISGTEVSDGEAN